MGSGLAARSVDMSEVPQASSFASPEEDHDRPLSGLTEDEYQALKKLVAKRAAAGEIGSLPSSARSAGPAIAVSPQSVGSHSSFYAQSEVCCDPPDMSLAVGPKYILQMVNNYVAVYDKSGNLQSGFPKPPTRSSPGFGYLHHRPSRLLRLDSGRYFVLELTETNTGNASGSPTLGP